MRQLLIDYIPFIPNQQLIMEAITQNKPVMVQGILQRAGVKNFNGRIYPKNILMREIQRYMNTEVKENRALGELDHPNSEIVNLANVSHTIREIHWDGDNVIGTIEILNTPGGNILKELLAAGIRLGISSRGLGSVNRLDNATVEVSDDYGLICFDMVSNPSTQMGWMSKINESRDSSVPIIKPKYYAINRIITDILTKKDEA